MSAVVVWQMLYVLLKYRWTPHSYPHWREVLRAWSVSPRIPRRRLKIQEETPRKQGDIMCIVGFDIHYGPVFSESLLGFGVSSGEFRDLVVAFHQESADWGSSNAYCAWTSSEAYVDWSRCPTLHCPATWKHGWSKHGSSTIPSKHMQIT